jgi:signal transduction histidine kinase
MWNAFRRLGRAATGHHAPNVAFALAACLVVATIFMFWLGYRATRQWDRGTRESVQARGNELLALLTIALERDMKGGQSRVLVPFNPITLDESSSYDLADRFAGAFARFPYLESIFIWRNTGGPGGLTYFFNRVERRPPWDRESVADELYPVVIRRNPAPAAALIQSARDYASDGTSFAVFECALAENPYQTVAHLIYAGDRGVQLAGLVGFTVNLEWVRHRYFADLLDQMQKISGDNTIRIEIRDAADTLVAESGPSTSGTDVRSKSFPLLFSDPMLVTMRRVEPAQNWTARVDVTTSAALRAARNGTERTLWLLTLGACVAIVALMLTVHATRAAADLAMRQSEFISSVTHEMKTPLSLISLASDSLVRGRYTSTDTIGEYGRMLATEARQLSRLIDNVLCYARLIDATSSYSFEQIDVPEMVGEAVDRFRLPLDDEEYDVQIDLPLSAPPIRGDRTMLRDALDNIIDNALRHGSTGKYLGVAVNSIPRAVQIEIADRGTGIPAEELDRIFDKFYRGKSAVRRGSGLGLAIARRIIEEHGGTVTVRSVIGEGTTVRIELPIAGAAT